MARKPADRDRDIAQCSDLGPLSALRFHELLAVQDVGTPAFGQVSADDRGTAARPDREEGDVCPDAARNHGNVAVVAVEDHPAIRSRDAADRRLHLGELGQRVNSLQVEVVRRDVG